MTLPIQASATALAAVAKAKPTHDPNPAQEAKADTSEPKGADFGAMVAGFAKAQGGKPAATPA